MSKNNRDKYVKRDKYMQYHAEMCDKMVQMTKKKNHDYSGFDDDPFANFKVVELCGIATVEEGFLTRIMDKVSRVNSFVKQGVLEVEDEKIEDTLLDLANYSILMSGYIKSKKDSLIKKM